MFVYMYEDIDVCFRKVLDILRRNDVEFLDDLVNMLLNIMDIKYVFDV